jgi:hypothetical protein
MTARSRPVEAPQTLADALAYLEHGWSVIPAPVRGKSGLVPWRRYQQTRPRPDDWQRWASRWPRANLAVITGRLSGIVVIDVDFRHGGRAGLDQVEAEHGELPWSAMVETPSGGWHLYLQHPGGRISNSASLLAPGVDVRGDGGLALLPPSRRPDGSAYRWHVGGPSSLEPMPPSLVAACRPHLSPDTASISVSPPVLSDARQTARFAGILRILEQAPAPADGRPGARNHALFWAALKLRDLIDQGAPKYLATDLEEAAVKRGLSRAEAKATIDSGLGQPRR